VYLKSTMAFHFRQKPFAKHVARLMGQASVGQLRIGMDGPAIEAGKDRRPNRRVEAIVMERTRVLWRCLRVSH